jgi:2'-5' RNA ligase
VSIRAFIAIELPQPARDALLSAGAAVREADRAWRNEKWVPAQNLHVTLKFLGSVAEDALEVLDQSMRGELAGCGAFDLELEGMRAVPRQRDARMLWGVLHDPSGACSDLAARVDRAALAIGVAPEERPFSPHVTLVRARRSHSVSPDALRAGGAPLCAYRPPMSVACASLFSSRTLPAGPEYRVVTEWQLTSE